MNERGEDMQLGQVIRILVVDQPGVIGSGIRAVLGAYPDFEVMGIAQSAEEVSGFCTLYPPDIVTIDPDLPGKLNGIELIGFLHQKLPRTQIVILTNRIEETTVLEMLRAGALSIVLKSVSVDELAYTIRSAFHGKPILSPEVTHLIIRGMDGPGLSDDRLTQREHQVLQLIAQGKNNSEIATALKVSLSTIQFHVSNILAKLHVHNRIEAATFAVRQEFIQPGRNRFK
jgi:two-component system, NarL family, response regulator LiaR